MSDEEKLPYQTKAHDDTMRYREAMAVFKDGGAGVQWFAVLLCFRRVPLYLMLAGVVLVLWIFRPPACSPPISRNARAPMVCMYQNFGCFALLQSTAVCGSLSLMGLLMYSCVYVFMHTSVLLVVVLFVGFVLRCAFCSLTAIVFVFVFVRFFCCGFRCSCAEALASHMAARGEAAGQYDEDGGDRT